MSKYIFVASLTVIAYTYVGYPLLAFVLSRLRARPIVKADVTPPVSVIIAAYNEELAIGRKIVNTLDLDYPCDLIEVIIASDCSSDGTDTIVDGFADRGVILCRQPFRHGKTAAQNTAARIAHGEILVFSDATTLYERGALRQLVRNFADCAVGCATGHVVYVDRKQTSVGRGARSYWGYEQFLKHCESRFNSLIGVHGCMYAVRRANYVDLEHDMSSDFVIATEIYRQGLRTVYEPSAVCFEETNVRARDEYRTRIRMIEQTMRALYRYREVLNPVRHGEYAMQMISHKVLRYLVPLFLVVLYLANIALVQESVVFKYLFLVQSAGYLVAFIGWSLDRIGVRLGPLALPYYFVLANWASIAAFMMVLRGEHLVLWEPIRDARTPDDQEGSQHTRRAAP